MAKKTETEKIVSQASDLAKEVLNTLLACESNLKGVDRTIDLARDSIRKAENKRSTLNVKIFECKKILLEIYHIDIDALRAVEAL